MKNRRFSTLKNFRRNSMVKRPKDNEFDQKWKNIEEDLNLHRVFDLMANDTKKKSFIDERSVSESSKEDHSLEFIDENANKLKKRNRRLSFLLKDFVEKLQIIKHKGRTFWGNRNT